MRQPGQIRLLTRFAVRPLLPLIAATAVISLGIGLSMRGAVAQQVSPLASIRPVLATDPVTDDADDPAIWVNRIAPGRSLIVGTNKAAAPAGALVVFGLDGKTRQTVAGVDRPNNVDVEYGWSSPGLPTVDVVVATERLQHRLRVFSIGDRADPLREIGTVTVLDGETGARAEPMGIALYRRASDGVLFAIVAPKLGGAAGYLAQYRLERDARGSVQGTLVRRFGAFSEQSPEPGTPGEIEAVVVDDELGFVYYADERFGIRKWRVDPDDPRADQEVAVIGRTGYELDREGLAIYRGERGSGYLVSVDQIPGRSALKFYARSGTSGSASGEAPLLHAITTVADGTDGLDVTSTPLPGFPRGLVVMMNSSGRNFLLFDWQSMAPKP